jgi:hypothetical protein
MNIARLAIALVVAPLVAPLAFFLLDGLATGSNWFGDGDGVGLEGGIAYLFGFLGLVVFGLPAAFTLRRYGRLSWITLTLLGAASGVVVYCGFLLFLAFALESSTNIGVRDVEYGAVIGAAVAFCFGAIAGFKQLES